jgi:hypothetical protein
MIRSFGTLLHGGLDDNLYKCFSINLNGIIYKRYCIDLRIRLDGYPNTGYRKFVDVAPHFTPDGRSE